MRFADLKAVYGPVTQSGECNPCKVEAESSNLSGSTKCSFNNRGLEQVTSVKTNPIRFIVRLQRIELYQRERSSRIRTCLKGDRRFGENPFYEKKWFTVMLLLRERYLRNAIKNLI